MAVTFLVPVSRSVSHDAVASCPTQQRKKPVGIATPTGSVFIHPLRMDGLFRFRRSRPAGQPDQRRAGLASKVRDRRWRSRHRVAHAHRNVGNDDGRKPPALGGTEVDEGPDAVAGLGGVAVEDVEGIGRVGAHHVCQLVKPARRVVPGIQAKAADRDTTVEIREPERQTFKLLANRTAAITVMLSYLFAAR